MKRMRFFRGICIFFAVVLMVSNTVVYAQSTSKEKIDITIKTEKQLRQFFSDLSKGNTYAGKMIKLANDIEVDCITGDSWILINTYLDITFEGTFDGAGHTISGIISTEARGVNGSTGLFGTVNRSGSVKNLILSESNYTFDHGLMGMIAGNNFGKISNCHVINSKLHCSGSSGGIVARNFGTVEDCSYETEIESNLSVLGLGGICYENSGKVINCSFGGTFNDYYLTTRYYTSVYAGDIAGYNAGVIANCFGYGSASLHNQESAHYGICSSLDEKKSILKNCYYAEEICDGAYPLYGGTIINVEDCTLEEMQTEEFVDKLNKTRGTSLAWSLEDGNGYPVHKEVFEVTFKSFDSKKGYIKSNKSYSSCGESVKLTAKIKKGYKLKSISVKTTSGKKVTLKKGKNGVYSFKMPNEDVVVSASVN